MICTASRAALGALPATLTLCALMSPAVAEEGPDERSLDSEHHALRVETVATGLEHPWGLALLPDGRFLVTERNPGQLRIGTAEGDLSDPVAGVPETFRYEGETGRSQAGLFDVKLDPEFAENQQILLSYSRPTERGAALTVTRARLVEADGSARLEDPEKVFVMKEDDQDSSGLHFGGRMAIHPEDGSIFLTIGDRRNISRAQVTDDQAGAILRFDLEGNPHPDNMFNREDADLQGDPFIHSIGHRNPQGLGFHPQTLELWSNEHGPLGGDEVNRIEGGNNYGWPYLTGGVDYSGAPIGIGTEGEGFSSAVHIFEGTVAPSGLVFYQGDAFPEWQGSLLNGGLVSEGLVRLEIEDDEVTHEERIELGRRIRDVQVDAEGAVWVITEHEGGEVLRLTLQ